MSRFLGAEKKEFGVKMRDGKKRRKRKTGCVDNLILFGWIGRYCFVLNRMSI